MNKSRTAGVLLLLLLFVIPVFAEPPLSPGDRIHIWVKGEADLTVDRSIGSDGSISYPLLGNVGLAGLTTREAAKVLAKMLDDGYLRNPLVQIDRSGGKTSNTSLPTPTSPEVRQISAEPLRVETGNADYGQAIPATVPSTKATKTGKSMRIEIVDGKSGDPVSNAAMLLGGKIYQANRLGQILLEESEGPMILMADGFRVIQEKLEHRLRGGTNPQIVMDKISLAKTVSVKVVDMATNNPLSDVFIRLDSIKVKTNSQGSFKIQEIKKEFGEIQLSKKGYKGLRRVLDFKDGLERIIPMMKDD